MSHSQASVGRSIPVPVSRVTDKTSSVPSGKKITQSFQLQFPHAHHRFQLLLYEHTLTGTFVIQSWEHGFRATGYAH